MYIKQTKNDAISKTISTLPNTLTLSKINLTQK